MKKLLWISQYVPYDGVVHAGGKTHNYYIKYFEKSKKFDIFLITLAEKYQEKEIDLDQYGISYDAEVVNSNAFKDIYRKIYNFRSMYDSEHRLCQTILSYQFESLKKRVIRYGKNNTPDIVIMQWTGAAFLLPLVKSLFPNAKTVIIEEDVSFLGYERKYNEEDNEARKKRKKKVYEKLRNRELELLAACDIVVLNNGKDKDLLLQNGIPEDKMQIVPPFYEDYSSKERNTDCSTILFYGVMSRIENHEAAVWFVENVMPLLEDMDVRFEIVGSNPKEELIRMSNERVHVRGYVDDVGQYLAKCLCMVVPLTLGAGIKVKVLEGLSAGVPILSSYVGIEGIPVEDGKEIFCCETPREYDTIIRSLIASDNLRDSVSEASRKFMDRTYNIDEKLDKLVEKLG
ncbi:MAG: glycosyltransferase [Lachnospiraceae bacterium]|jgi:glycosyltransferase involved in cell wall biosynthesis|nr:glycosyltransferase [Lachnospiraceae bacterium]